MNDRIESKDVTCSQCGGELHPGDRQIFLTCPYCESTVYLDKSQVVMHWYIVPTVDEGKARAALARWMSSDYVENDLEKNAQINTVTFEYFPLWYFKIRRQNGEEMISIEPAAGTLVTALKRLKLPAGTLRRYNQDLEQQSQIPTVPLKVALNRLRYFDNEEDEIIEQALVHVPVYTFKYTYRGYTNTVLVEAGLGGVFTNFYPAKQEEPFLLVSGITFVVYLFIALIPVWNALIDNGRGLGESLLMCTGLGILAAPILFALAVWIAEKV